MTSQRAISGTPGVSEMSPMHMRFLEQIRTDDIVSEIERFTVESLSIAATVPSEKETFRYAPGKWSVREVVGHVTDCERIFCARIVAVSRADDRDILSFDEDLYAAHAGHDAIPLADLVEEFAAVRRATVQLLSKLDHVQWRRTANIAGYRRSCRSVAWSIAGHSVGHFRFLRERYLQDTPGTESVPPVRLSS